MFTLFTAQAIVSRFDICADISKYGSEAESRSTFLNMPKDGQEAKCEKHLVWTWQSSYAGKHDKFAGVTISPDKNISSHQEFVEVKPRIVFQINK